jgi:SOS-response transcriptional repressor LexA
MDLSQTDILADLPVRCRSMVGARSTEWIEQVLRSGRTVDLELRGHSMAPGLRDGDLLAVEPLDRPVPGDVVLARLGDLLMAHRVLAFDGERAVLRGDASRRVDSLPLDHLLGRVVAVRRRRGRLERLFRRVVRGVWR